MNEWVEGSVGGAGQRGVVKEFHASETAAVAPCLEGEEKWRVEERGARAKGRHRSDAGSGKRGRSLRGSPHRAAGPRPAPPPPSQTPPPAYLRPGRVSPPKPGPAGTRASSPDAPAAARRSASSASLQPATPRDQLIHGGGASASRGPAGGERARRRWDGSRSRWD